MNKLLRAVEDYIDDEREYVRFAEREIQVLEQKARDERRQTQRQMIAALYWRAGATMVLAERAEKAGNGPRAERLINDGAGTWNAARAMEAACPR